jgi:hypothetical protein
MSLHLNDEDSDNVIVNIIDDAVVVGDVTGIGNALASNKRLWMANASTRMVYQLVIDFVVFLIELRI